MRVPRVVVLAGHLLAWLRSRQSVEPLTGRFVERDEVVLVGVRTRLHYLKNDLRIQALSQVNRETSYCNLYLVTPKKDPDQFSPLPTSKSLLMAKHWP